MLLTSRCMFFSSPCAVAVAPLAAAKQHTLRITVNRCGAPGTSWNARRVGRKSQIVKKQKLSHAPMWLLNPPSGKYAPSTYIQTQPNTGGPELRSCVQSSGLTAGTVRWHLYYVTWGVLEDCTSICFLSCCHFSHIQKKKNGTNPFDRGERDLRRSREVLSKFVVGILWCIWILCFLLCSCVSTGSPPRPNSPLQVNQAAPQAVPLVALLLLLFFFI